MELTPYSLSLSEPLSTARGKITEREGVVVAVEAHGTTGVGEAAPLPGWTEPLDECRAALERARERADDGEGREAALRACAGTSAARHGVALAYADARARASGLPLYRWLGDGEPVDSVPVNATVGDGDRGATVERAREAVAAGYPAIKLKVGARDVAVDVERLAAVRAACPEVELRVDANGAWSRAEAEHAFDAIADAGVDLAYVEQPLPAPDLAGLAELRGRDGGSPPVAVDETLAEHSLAAVLSAGAADAVVCKPMVFGGPGRTREAAVRAARAGIRPVVTTTVDGAVARAGAVHVAASLPGIDACGLATGGLLADDLCPDPFPVENGTVRPGRKEGNIPLSTLGRYA
ncbi:MAG: mandelate racemase/muconate lactonizing enzyme family protein [Haloarculaceae archaeon]